MSNLPNVRVGCLDTCFASGNFPVQITVGISPKMTFFVAFHSRLDKSQDITSNYMVISTECVDFITRALKYFKCH
jgi:hypothetical protein